MEGSDGPTKRGAGLPGDSASVGRQERLRLPIDRRKTALFIALSDFTTVLVVSLIEVANLSSLSDAWGFPVAWVSVGVMAIVIRMVALVALTDAWKAFFNGCGQAYRWFLGLFSEGDGSEADFEPPRAAPKRRFDVDKERIKDPSLDRLYYLLLAIGIIAQVVIVAATGGAADSPFIEILVATFILGQVRAPSQESAWTLFVSGIASVVAAHLLYLLLRHADVRRFEHVTYGTIAHVLPLLVVALMSTVVTVSQISARLEESRHALARSSDLSASSSHEF